MQTRSQTRYNSQSKYEVNIDFDDASVAWKANKKSIGNGVYKYICMHNTNTNTNTNTNQKQCNRKPLSGCNFCKIHHVKQTNE